MAKRLISLFLISCLFTTAAFGQMSISIISGNGNLSNPATILAIKDATALLRQACGCRVEVNDTSASVQLILPDVDSSSYGEPTIFSEQAGYPYLYYPSHEYTWTSEKLEARQYLWLRTKTFEGVCFGLYGLLQEQLDFLFHHPRETIMPELDEWPLPEQFEWDVYPRFDKKGFHLHTMHPLELTEQLLDHGFENGLRDVYEYIDWLARNQQNYFEFNLLESIDLDEWPDYAAKIVDYCHSRGILAGVDVSMHMIQQKAFMLYKTPPKSFRKKRVQIERALEKLMQADWDVFNVEFSTTEFTSGNQKKKEKLRLFLTDKLMNDYGVKLMGRKHVVKESEQVMGKKDKGYEMNEAEKKLDANRGILIHTVMFYTISEEKAPVYQNENLRHMLDELHKEQKVRETWYYPESAYWITFDNAIPMTLLPYLNARLDDIELMDSLGIPGHITFSSGWEWGYWLIDWSIARWSWGQVMNGDTVQYRPLSALNDIFEDEQVQDFFKQQLDLQQEYIKDKELIRYMAASTPTDELPPPLNLEFQPRPHWKYKYLRKRADMETVNLAQSHGVNRLLEFADQSEALFDEYEDALEEYAEQAKPIKGLLLEELTHGLAVTTLRARHRAYTLHYLLEKRRAELENTEEPGNALMEQAIEARNAAQELVEKCEERYRYPVELIGRKRMGHTAYRAGYLYPVSELHFWKREEEQVLRDRYGAFFMGIWNIPRILGVTD